MIVLCEACDYSGALETYRPNISSVHNIIRCPKCGSTKNRYNGAHSTLISRMMRMEIEGPVTHELVVKELEETE